MQPIVKIAAQNIGITSLDKLGRHLCEQFPDIEWPSPRSLGVKLGELNKGKTGWWAKRPEFVSKLSDVLECAPQDLGIHIGAERHDSYEFEDFPELQPLDLKRESPCELGYFTDDNGKPVDLFDTWRGPHSVGVLGTIEEAKATWLFFPKGTGRDLYWAKLKAQSPHECLESNTVASQADRFKKSGSIYLNVNDSAGKRDLLALQSKNKGTAVLICAPFKLEKTDELEQTSRGEFINGFKDDLVAHCEWHLHADWRQRLLKWIEKRLTSHPDTLFDSKGLSAWLNQFSDQSIFDTPRNLVEICRFSHHYGHKKLPFAKEPKAGSKLLSLIDLEQPEYCEDFSKIVHKWLLSIDLPWNGHIDVTCWREFSTTGNSDQAYNAKLMERIVEEPESEKRKKLSLKFNTQIEIKPFNNLIDTRFLNQSETGDISLAPHFLADLLAREHLYNLITEKDHRKWAALCFEPSRSELVQQAIDLLTIEELSNFSSHILDEYQEDIFGIGATEAIFCAVGRRRSTIEQTSSFFINIAEVVIKRMLSLNILEPKTCSSAIDNKALWIAICWRWSLICPKPSLTLPEAWSGYFPGWFNAATNTGWHWLPTLDLEIVTQRMSTTEQCLLQSASDITQLFSKPGGGVLPDILIPFLLSRGIKQKWQIPENWWLLILENKWAQGILVNEIHASKESATVFLISLINCAISYEAIAGELSWFMLSSGPLQKHLFEKPNHKHVIAHLDKSGLILAEKIFGLLPLTFQQELLNHYRHSENSKKWWLLLSPKLGNNLISSVIPWLYNEGDESNLVALWLWGRSPEKAQDLLISEDNKLVKQLLVKNYHGKIKYLPSVIQALNKDHFLLSKEEMRTLVMDYLPTSAGLAPELIDLLNQCT